MTYDDRIDNLFQKAARYLSYRARSRGEIQRYLAKKTDNDQDLIDAVINKIELIGGINDEEFAASWARSRINKGKGKKIIRLELLRKDISKYIIDQTLQSLSIDKIKDKALTIAQKKYPQGISGYKEKSKAYRWLYGRGFGSKIINAVIDELMQDRVE